MSLRNIVWLASYPKSGNTWTRIFLANYLFAKAEPFPINQLSKIGMGDSRVKRYREVAPGPFDPSNDLDCMKRRQLVLRRLAGNGADINFSKTHNQNDVVFGLPLIPEQFTRAAIYIIRDPRDVVLSYADHFDKSLAESVEDLADQNASSGGAADSQTVRQFFGNWSQHVRSWTTRGPFPVTVLRYEDLQEAPERTFTSLLQALEIPVEQARLEQAIAFSQFNTVRAQEDKDGFNETPRSADRFFNSGTSGRWREDLPGPLADRIAAQHGEQMRRFGYLDTA